MKDLEDILRLARRRSGEPIALATIVRTHGSSYRAVGTRMIVAADGSSAGALSAGCLEEDVRLRARAVIATGRPVLVPYDTRRLFGCDGRIDVFIERAAADGDWLRFLARCFERRERGVSATVFQSRAEDELRSVRVLFGSRACQDAPSQLLERFESEAAAAIETGESGVVEIEGSTALLHVIDPPVRLVLAGGAYDARPVTHLARALGWQVTILARPEDDRSAFGDVEVLPVTAPDEWPIAADQRTAALIMTHHFGRDAAFLRQMLRLPLGYIGLLGPRRRRERLLDAIASDAEASTASRQKRLHNPAGLDVGAETPEEIALAVISEIQAVMTQSAAGFLSDRKGPIHRRGRNTDIAASVATLR